MNRSDLESKVRISVGPASPGGRAEMTATLEVEATACLDPYVLSCVPAFDVPRLVEAKLRECVVREVLGDLEAENQRLRHLLRKWGERAIGHMYFCSPDDRRKVDLEFEEDLR